MGKKSKPTVVCWSPHKTLASLIVTIPQKESNCSEDIVEVRSKTDNINMYILAGVSALTFPQLATAEADE